MQNDSVGKQTEISKAEEAVPTVRMREPLGESYEGFQNF